MPVPAPRPRPLSRRALVAGLLAARPSLAHAGPAETTISTITVSGTTTGDIQTAIDQAVGNFTGAGSPTMVHIPEGVYTVTAQIRQPPWVHVVADGRVDLRCAVGGTSAWIIAPVADGGSRTSGYPKAEYSSGIVLDGSAGGINLLRTGGATTTGLELGSTTDLGLPMANYMVSGVTVDGFNTGIRLNSYHHYLGTLLGIGVQNCADGIVVGSASGAKTDSGEDFRLIGCLIGSGETGIRVLATGWGFDLGLYGCSLDFLTKAMVIGGNHLRILLSGGHIEGINAGSRYDPAGHGGIAISQVTDSTPDSIPALRLDHVVLVDDQRNTKFTGPMSLDLDVEYRNKDDLTSHQGAADGYLCGPGVRLRRARMSAHAAPAPSRARTDFPNPFLTRESAASDTAAMVDWRVSVTGDAVASVQAAGSMSGARAVRVSMTAGSATVVSAYRAPCRSGERLAAWCEYDFTETPWPELSVTFTFHDAAGARLTASTVLLTRTATAGRAWRLPDGPAQVDVPPAAASYTAGWTVALASGGDASNPYFLSGLIATSI